MKLLKYIMFGSSTSPFVIALVLSFILTLFSTIILFSTAAKPKIIFNPAIKEQIVPLSIGLIVIAIVSFIFVYVLAIKTKRVKNE